MAETVEEVKGILEVEKNVISLVLRLQLKVILKKNILWVEASVWFVKYFVFVFFYLYSAQYLHILQDSKRYMTHPTAQVQSNSQITDIPLSERQSLKHDHLSTSLRFFNLPLGIGPNDRRPPF